VADAGQLGNLPYPLYSEYGIYSSAGLQDFQMMVAGTMRWRAGA